MTTIELSATIYFILFALSFFIFSVQRTALLIEREFSQSYVSPSYSIYQMSDHKSGSIFIPSWAPTCGVTLLLLKVATLFFIFNFLGWGYALCFITADIVLHAILPIPSKWLKWVFFSRAMKISQDKSLDAQCISNAMVIIINKSRYLN
ncbi:hypothetical protein WFU86_003736 [Proteus mirabilis]|uniref:hypothetical protein n=1 Tax=Proteus mirabilis TaxID=584 RepID=UPI0009ABDC75|nr:hypothetical protein [Proteus mirabilis]ARA24474.1 hypothetical protein AM438_19045 [Proteus mirabilis]